MQDDFIPTQHPGLFLPNITKFREEHNARMNLDFSLDLEPAEDNDHRQLQGSGFLPLDVTFERCLFEVGVHTICSQRVCLFVCGPYPVFCRGTRGFNNWRPTLARLLSIPLQKISVFRSMDVLSETTTLVQHPPLAASLYVTSLYTNTHTLFTQKLSNSCHSHLKLWS